MKHPEVRMSLEAALPSIDSVQSWLSHQLEVRGIDSIVYTRYIISLLQNDYTEHCDVDDIWNNKCETVKKSERKTDKKKYPSSDEEKKKMAVLDCLQSVSDQDCDLEKLVDELWKRLNVHSTSNYKEFCTPLSVDVDPINDNAEMVTISQDPTQRYYDAFPALSAEDSPSSVSPSLSENVWKRNPLMVHETQTKSSVNNKSTDTAEPELRKVHKSYQQAKNLHKNTSAKSDMKEDIQKKRAQNTKKKIKVSRPKPRPSQIKKFMKKHNSSVHCQSLPLTLQQSFEKDGTKEEKSRDEAEYCCKVEQIIKSLILCNITENKKKSNNLINIDWPEWMRDETVSPELQENFDWYTQPLDEIFVTPFSERLYKRHSFPPSNILDDLEFDFGPLLSPSRSMDLMDDVFLPTKRDGFTKHEEVHNVPHTSPTVSPLPCEQRESVKQNENSSAYSFDYSSPTDGCFSLFDFGKDENINQQEELFLRSEIPTRNCGKVQRESTNTDQSTSIKTEYPAFGNFEDCMDRQASEQAKETFLELGKKRFESLLEPKDVFMKNNVKVENLEDICNYVMYNAWSSTPDMGDPEDCFLVDLCKMSSCSSSFDSEDGTDMSDFEGIFTFDPESEDENNITITVPTEAGPDLPYDINVPDGTIVDGELIESFNSTIENPVNTRFCSMLIDRQYLSQIIQSKYQDPIDIQSPCKIMSPSMHFSLWSLEKDKPEHCQLNSSLVHDFFQSFNDDYTNLYLPWNDVIGESSLQWNLIPNRDQLDWTENAKPAQLYQLWNVNSKKKMPWTGLLWNIPCDFNNYNVPNETVVEENIQDSDWGPVEKTEQTGNHAEVFVSHETFIEDAVIGVELLEELHKEINDDLQNNFYVSLSKCRSNSSVSDSDIHGLWTKFGTDKPKFHHCFELVPSESSAFTDAIPCKMLNLENDLNSNMSSVVSVASNKYNVSSEVTSFQGDHPYYSDDTHFRPIQTPVGTHGEEKIQQRPDLFGENWICSSTLYQQFYQPDSDSLPMFCPKFKVQKSLDKYIQTGRSLDKNYDSKIKPKISVSDQCSIGVDKSQTIDMLDITCDAEDPFGKESGFEYNGEIDDFALPLKDDGDTNPDKAEMDSRFGHFWFDDSDQNMSFSMFNVWKKQTNNKGVSRDLTHNSASNNNTTSDTGHYAQYLQYLPLIQHGELKFSKNCIHPSQNNSNQLFHVGRRSMNPNQQTEFKDSVDNVTSKNQEFDTTKVTENFGRENDFFGDEKWSILEDKERELKWNSEVSSKTDTNVTVANIPDSTNNEYNVDVLVNSIPNSVNELSQYFILRDEEHHPSTLESLQAHDFNFDVRPTCTIPLPDTAVYSSDLELMPDVSSIVQLPKVAVYSSDLEKQWLDDKNAIQGFTDGLPYLNVLETGKKTKPKIKNKSTGKKPCSFFLEGTCKRADCKYSHDFSKITCRFWEEGMCFKGTLCPFLHGYHIISNNDSPVNGNLKFELKKEEFPKLQLKEQTSSKGRSEKKKRDE